MTRILTIIALLFATPAWAEQLTVVQPIHDVLGKRGARVLHSHGGDASVVMTVVLDQKGLVVFSDREKWKTGTTVSDHNRT